MQIIWEKYPQKYDLQYLLFDLVQDHVLLEMLDFIIAYHCKFLEDLWKEIHQYDQKQIICGSVKSLNLIIWRF